MKLEKDGAAKEINAFLKINRTAPIGCHFQIHQLYDFSPEHFAGYLGWLPVFCVSIRRPVRVSRLLV